MDTYFILWIIMQCLLYFVAQISCQWLFHLLSNIWFWILSWPGERWEKGSSSKWWDKPKTWQPTSDFQISVVPTQPTRALCCCPEDWLRSPGSSSQKVKQVTASCRRSLCVWPLHSLEVHSQGKGNYIPQQRNKKNVWTAMGHNEAVQGSINSAAL